MVKVKICILFMICIIALELICGCCSIVPPSNNQQKTPTSASGGGSIPSEILTGKIAFLSFRDGSDEIYIMDPNGNNQHRVSSCTGGGWTDNDQFPVWSPDGSKIVFTSWRYGTELFVVNIDGTGETRLTADTPGKGTGSSDPSWSPDGSKIAFESERYGESLSRQIYIMNADGSNQRILTKVDTYSFESPSWSPDGNFIVAETHWGWVSGSQHDAGGIYIFNVNDGMYSQLTHSSDDHNAVWSPDGSQIAFYRRVTSKTDNAYTTTSEIYIMHSDGTNAIRLTQGINPSWSPDGSKIAFISDRDGNGLKLWVINSNGSGEKNLMNTFNHIGEAWTPSWSPDGKKLVFEYDGEIYLINADGSGLKKVTNGAKSGLGPVWSK